MNRKTAKLIRNIAPESGARKRARIARERFLRTVFYQGAHPLNEIEGPRPCYMQDSQYVVNIPDELARLSRAVISRIVSWSSLKA